MSDSFDHDRAVLEISGEDRDDFLQGIITQDVAQLKEGALLFAAILSPQGKLAHDFFLRRQGDAILLDAPAAMKDALTKRLTMYKLRAKVTIRDVSDSWHVAYVTSGGLADPRHPRLPQRLITQSAPQHPLTVEAYHAERIALSVPESPFDTTADDVAMDLGYDLLNAISFTKGCYVGQEVTARMHHKNIARRGFFHVTASGALPAAGSEIRAGEVKVGTLRGTRSGRGLALVKFEEVEAAIDANKPFLVDNQPVELKPPAWLSPKLAQFHATRENQ